MTFPKLGCLTISSAALLILLLFSFGEFQEERVSGALSNESSRPDSISLPRSSEERFILRPTSDFWQILDFEEDCINVPHLAKNGSSGFDETNRPLRISQISATINVYRKDRPDPDLPVTADSVLVPKEDFSFSTNQRPTLDPIVINGKVCNVSFRSENGATLTLKETISHIFGKTSTDVAILQLYVHYSDEKGLIVHTASLLLRSDADAVRTTTEI